MSNPLFKKWYIVNSFELNHCQVQIKMINYIKVLLDHFSVNNTKSEINSFFDNITNEQYALLLGYIQNTPSLLMIDINTNIELVENNVLANLRTLILLRKRGDILPAFDQYYNLNQLYEYDYLARTLYVLDQKQLISLNNNTLSLAYAKSKGSTQLEMIGFKAQFQSQEIMIYVLLQSLVNYHDLTTLFAETFPRYNTVNERIFRQNIIEGNKKTFLTLYNDSMMVSSSVVCDENELLLTNGKHDIIMNFELNENGSDFNMKLNKISLVGKNHNYYESLHDLLLRNYKLQYRVCVNNINTPWCDINDTNIMTLDNIYINLTDPKLMDLIFNPITLVRNQNTVKIEYKVVDFGDIFKTTHSFNLSLNNILDFSLILANLIDETFTPNQNVVLFDKMSLYESEIKAQVDKNVYQLTLNSSTIFNPFTSNVNLQLALDQMASNEEYCGTLCFKNTKVRVLEDISGESQEYNEYDVENFSVLDNLEILSQDLNFIFGNISIINRYNTTHTIMTEIDGIVEASTTDTKNHFITYTNSVPLKVKVEGEINFGLSLLAIGLIALLVLAAIVLIFVLLLNTQRADQTFKKPYMKTLTNIFSLISNTLLF